MGKILGKNIAVFRMVGERKVLIGLSTSCSVDLNTDMVELAALASAFRSYKAGRSGGTISVERLFSATDSVPMMYMQVHRIPLKYVVEVEGMTIAGEAYISSQSANAPAQGYASHRVTLTCTGEIAVDAGYIAFADSVVGALCVDNWGDGIGLTKNEAADITNVGTIFRGNTLITSFSEFGYFGVTNLKQYAFSGCTRLATLGLPDSLKICEEYSLYKSGITSMVGKVERIYGWAVSECPNLKTVDLTEVVSVGGYAFYRCAALSSVTLGKVTSIGSNAFNGCQALRYLYLRPTTPPTLAHENALNDTSDSMIIYVPKGSLSAYQAATNWNMYANRMVEYDY